MCVLLSVAPRSRIGGHAKQPNTHQPQTLTFLSEQTCPGKEPTCEQTRPGKAPTSPKHQLHTPERAQHQKPGPSRLAAPTFADGAEVTGTTKEKWRLQNKRARIEQQATQVEQSLWRAHKGNQVMPPQKQRPTSFRNEMCPNNLALHLPAAGLLLQYATKGCPTRTGQNWTKDEMEAAIEKGPHPSALVPEAAEQLRQETAEKVKKGQARIVRWEGIRDDPPKELKISPVAMIPHKSRGFRAILDLSYSVRLADKRLSSVNESTVKTAPHGAIDQMGHVLHRIIHAFAEVEKDSKIFMAKWDIKDGFWRLDCEAGQEWNFCYVLPASDPNAPIELVVPTS